MLHSPQYILVLCDCADTIYYIRNARKYEYVNYFIRAENINPFCLHLCQKSFDFVDNAKMFLPKNIYFLKKVFDIKEQFIFLEQKC